MYIRLVANLIFLNGVKERIPYRPPAEGDLDREVGHRGADICYAEIY